VLWCFPFVSTGAGRACNFRDTYVGQEISELYLPCTRSELSALCSPWCRTSAFPLGVGARPPPRALRGQETRIHSQDCPRQSLDEVLVADVKQLCLVYLLRPLPWFSAAQLKAEPLPDIEAGGRTSQCSLQVSPGLLLTKACINGISARRISPWSCSLRSSVRVR
jgi:hypothetical protein